MNRLKTLAALSRCALLASAGAALLGLATPVLAQTASAADIAALKAQMDALRAEHQRTAVQIQQIQMVLDRVTGTASAAPPATLPASAEAPAVALAGLAPSPSRFALSGDFRLRYELNSGDRDLRDRNRGVLRARLRPTYVVNDWLMLGGQIATGDPDDPNSTDITLSNFDDDLQVSLDQAYARATFGPLILHGGKIPQPFARTELVWDGDVSPQGLSAAYKQPLAGAATIKLSGLYALIDEAVTGPDSHMAGAQLTLETNPKAPWRLEASVGYFDYTLPSVAGADAGDFRSNLLRPDGHYLSDFNLINGLVALTYQGFGPRWPVRLVGDYVKNQGAATSADAGFGVDALIGRASKPGDWRIGYGYAQAETDAVFAAFSQDNTNIATNYRQHAFSLDYVGAPNITWNATYYRYRPLHAATAGANQHHDWLDRLRLNMLVAF